MTSSLPAPPGERRMHVGLAVRRLADSQRFYEILLGEPPSKVRPGYAKFEPRDPSLNLSLTESARAATPTAAAAPTPALHFGLQVHTPEAVRAVAARLAAAGLSVETEEGTTCCYAVQDKAWVTDPDGHRWEIFTVLQADAPARKTSCCDV